MAARGAVPPWPRLAAVLLAAGALGVLCCQTAFSAAPAPPRALAATAAERSAGLVAGGPNTGPLSGSAGALATTAATAAALAAVFGAARASRAPKGLASRVPRRFADDSAGADRLKGLLVEALRDLLREDGVRTMQDDTYVMRVHVAAEPQVAAAQDDVQAQAPAVDSPTSDCGDVAGVESPTVRQEWSRLNSELANSRLALLASMGSQLNSGTASPTSGRGPLRAGIARRAKEKDDKVDQVVDYEWDEDAPELEEKVFDPREQIGAMPPLGYFDPLGFCKVGDEETFNKYRSMEIKHGRVAMMATVGSVVEHYVKLPGFEFIRTHSFKNVLQETFSAPGIYWTTIFLASLLLLEINFWIELPYAEPGNFGDPLGIGMYDKETREKELNNGRFAMFAAAGIVAAQAYTGKDGVEQILGAAAMNMDF